MLKQDSHQTFTSKALTNNDDLVPYHRYRGNVDTEARVVKAEVR